MASSFSSDPNNQIQVTVDSIGDPPQVVVARMIRTVREINEVGIQRRLHLTWIRRSHPQRPSVPDDDGVVSHHPYGYRRSTLIPVLRGPEYCPHCLCGPCVIDRPPEFLMGMCGPHPANDEKRHRLYRLFWRVLKDLGLWMDEEYLRRKEQRTIREDRRDIIPNCVITEIRGRYPSVDGTYRDYLSTFDAEQLV